MDLLTLFYYFFAFATGITALGISFHMYHKYQLKYLFFYSIYLVIHYILGYFVLIGLDLIKNLSFFSFESKSHISELFGILRVPFIPLMLYMFLKMEKGILKRNIPASLRNIFFFFWAILFVLYLLGVRHYLNSMDYIYLSMILRVVLLATGVCLYLAALELFIRSKSLANKTEQKSAKTIGFMYLAIFSVYAVTMLLTILQLVRVGSPAFSIYIFAMHFSFNIPPLLYLRHYLKKNYTSPLLSSFSETKMDNVFDKFNISKREAEIIRLMLKGKRAKDIERELFISYHTVRNHIYNIYRKMNVKNRMQVFQLIQAHLHEQDE